MARISVELMDSLVNQADTAFLNIAYQAHILLDGAAQFFARHPIITMMDRTHHKELASGVNELGSIPRMLVDEINRWKKGERILSSNGVELNLLNELYANMEAMMLFLTRNNIELPGFSLDLVKASYSELLRCNRLL